MLVRTYVNICEKINNSHKNFFYKINPNISFIQIKNCVDVNSNYEAYKLEMKKIFKVNNISAFIYEFTKNDFNKINYPIKYNNLYTLLLPLCNKFNVEENIFQQKDTELIFNTHADIIRFVGNQITKKYDVEAL